MYAGGSSHPNKAPSLAFLERVALGELDACMDAEVLQEIPDSTELRGSAHSRCPIATGGEDLQVQYPI